MRVAPRVRGRGLSGRLNEAAVAWARSRGATVGRIMVFSSNAAGLAAAQGVGFDPVTAVRWAHVTPDPAADPELPMTADADVAWDAWTTGTAREQLAGLAHALEESWALQRLTRETLERAAAGSLLVAIDAAAATGLAFRVWDHERDRPDEGADRCAVYGVATWSDPASGTAILAAVARDATTIGADRTRVLLPNTPRDVSDAALAGAEPTAEPDVVLARPLDRD